MTNLRLRETTSMRSIGIDGFFIWIPHPKAGVTTCKFGLEMVHQCYLQYPISRNKKFNYAPGTDDGQRQISIETWYWAYLQKALHEIFW